MPERHPRAGDRVEPLGAADRGDDTEVIPVAVIPVEVIPGGVVPDEVGPDELGPGEHPPTVRLARGALARRLALVAVVAGIIAVVHLSGVLDVVTDDDRLRSAVDSAGWWGPMLFVAAFTVLVAIGVPGVVFVVPASVIYPAPAAIALCLAGGYTSSSVGVVFARTVGRDVVARRLPERFRRWDEAIARRGLVAVIGLRIVTYLAAPADWLLGLSSIPTRTILVGTAIGLVPPTLVYVVLGGGIFDLVT